MKFQKICLARFDRIGDLVVSLPCDQWVRQKFPKVHVKWFVHPQAKIVKDHYEFGADLNILNPPGNSIFSKWKAARNLAREMRSMNLDLFVGLHVPWWIAAAAFLAGVPERVGPLSQWYSFLFYNRGMRQRRSLADRHESQFGLDLLSFALKVEAPTSIPGITLSPQEDEVQKMKMRLRDLEIEKFVVIHPGMLGSAKNWSQQNYSQLMKKLTLEKFAIIVTGTKSDMEWIREIDMQGQPHIFNWVGQTTPNELMALLSLSTFMVAPSTGVAHLGASLGTPVLGLYSPVRVQAPLRWRPLGPKVKVFVPQVACPGKLNCIGQSCEYFDCMGKITVDEVFSSAVGLKT